MDDSSVSISDGNHQADIEAALEDAQVEGFFDNMIPES